MKTFKTWLLTMTVLLCSTTVNAHDFQDYYEGKNIYFNIVNENDKTVEVTFQGSYPDLYEEYSGSVVIPSTTTRFESDGENGYIQKTYNVIGINQNTFQKCKNLTSLTIPSSITTIEENAFEGCNSLKEIHISDLSAWCKIEFVGVSNPLYQCMGSYLYLNGSIIRNLPKIRNSSFQPKLCCN